MMIVLHVQADDDVKSLLRCSMMLLIRDIWCTAFVSVSNRVLSATGGIVAVTEARELGAIDGISLVRQFVQEERPFAVVVAPKRLTRALRILRNVHETSSSHRRSTM